jgi:hypothetical protein
MITFSPRYLLRIVLCIALYLALARALKRIDAHVNEILWKV